MDNLFTVKQVAFILKVHPLTIIGGKNCRGSKDKK
jgi:hypothetical protein